MPLPLRDSRTFLFRLRPRRAARGLYTEDRSEVVPKQITYSSIVRVLVVGFSTVIVLLVAAGAIALNNAHSIKESAGSLVRDQLTTTRLVEEVEREQEAINAVFFKLSRGTDIGDRERVFRELDQADQNIERIVDEASGTSDEPLWDELREASLSFSAEARRLLSLKNMPSYSSRDLFVRHEEVTSVIAHLVSSGSQRALAARNDIDRRSSRLVRDALLLLGGCVLAALACAWLTVRITTQLFRKMEWQTGELSRVSWRLLENQESTAQRFSHELHDELGQSLTAIKANLLALDSADPAGKARIEDCRRVVEEAIGNVRELSHLLRPTILDDFGLDASIRWLAERFTQRTGIAVDYHSSFNGRLPDETETHLFRIVQEALTNVARHSGASRVSIDMRTSGDRVCLTLEDNGRGLEPGEGQGSSGMGMIGMRARARSAGGELTVKSRRGAGVQIEVWAPLAGARPDERKSRAPVSEEAGARS
jgi:signal transduction histidine kinase